MQYTQSGFGPQNNNTGWGTQYNNNGPGSQNISYGGDQNIYQNFIEPKVDSRIVLWDAIKHVGFSHNAEQQFSRGDCLEGTREEVLQIIHSWRIPDSWEPPICWLGGAVGVGKTSIALSVAKSCQDAELVASFFFFRSDPHRSNPSALILAIAHGLAATNDLVRNEINSRIKVDRSILGARLEEQFQELVVQPVAKRCARQIAADHCFVFNEPILIIIDGLDECDDEETQLRILFAISSAYERYPRFPLRFLICSRPEAWIREAFESRPLLDATKVITLDEQFESAGDIERYYIHEFQQIRENPKYRAVQFPDPWPSWQDLRDLVWRSDSQFAYASTAVRFVRLPFSNPLKQLRLILAYTPSPDLRGSVSPFNTLDSLYHIILAANPNRDEILPILSAIVILPTHVKRNPSPDLIELLLGLLPGDVSLTLRALHSVLNIRGPSDGITAFHTSFTDYLCDQTRSGDFFIDQSAQHDFLIGQWLPVISRDRLKGYR